MRKFGELESVLDLPNSKNKEVIEREKHFLSTHQSSENKKFLVKLPIEDSLELGVSFDIANQRLNSLKRRLYLNLAMSFLFSNFMEDKQLGQMEELNDANSYNLHYVLLHHGVFKASSNTTKLRLVLNLSSLSANGVSLNDYMLNESVVQDDFTWIDSSPHLLKVFVSNRISRIHELMKNFF
ncbi:DUF1758 domain-containing protein [Trichonephila clavata]|uniref:DUF1758 domain-containing protein n=1 Tax=Trichonephila clavata TaxID=2740835 RepID=A0A8X6H2N4_TRICU|nr:DUF1758 domain-containing protein [Trichonephila clavata]